MHSTAIAPRTELVLRHALVVRITHWVNALCLLVLLMSGLQIFNAHATLYWGSKSEPDRAILSMRAVQRDDGSYAGITTIGSHTFDTTGVLGLSGSGENLESRGFPAWITLPSYRDLATGRRWHFAFAWLFVLNGLAYLIYTIASGHARRDLAPTRGSSSTSVHRSPSTSASAFPRVRRQSATTCCRSSPIWPSSSGCCRSRFSPVSTMSPALDAVFPFLLDLFGGRQSARTVHFLCASGIVLFVLVHVFMVLVSGVWNNLRSMITGRYAIETSEGSHG